MQLIVIQIADAKSEVFMGQLSEDEAKKYAHNASYLAIASAALTGIIVAYKFIKTGTQDINILNVADVFIMLAFAYGIWRYSRICIIGAFSYYVVSQVRHYLNGISVNYEGVGLIVTVLFSYFYIQGIRGIFALHSLRKKE